MESSIFSNIIKGHTKTTLSMRQVDDHVRPGLTRRVPTICVLLSSFFQERVCNFTIKVLLLQNATITSMVAITQQTINLKLKRKKKNRKKKGVVVVGRSLRYDIMNQTQKQRSWHNT